MNVVEPIFAQCQNKPSDLALCAPGTEFNLVSYTRLRRSVNGICRRLIAAGIAPRSRFAVLIDDPVFHAVVLIALTRLGIVTISGEPQNLAWPIKLDAAIADKPGEFPGGPMILANPAWMTEGDQDIEEKYLFRAAPDDVCRLFSIPGRHGDQYVIALTNRMITTRLDRQKLFFGPRAPFCDRTGVDLPLSTPLGFQVLLATLWRGGALVMSRDVRKTIAALAVYNLENLVVSPQGLRNLVETIEKPAGFHSALEAVFCVGPTESQFASERAWTRLSPNVTIGYMAADATMVASMPAHLSSGISGAAGYVLPGVTVEIVDEQGHVVPPESEGIVRIRSDYGVTGYLENPVETQRAFRDGWFYSGDRGRFTRDNLLILAGSPAGVRTVADQTAIEEIEAILSEHTNVVQCAVTALANETGAHELCAFVVPRSYLDVEALRTYCKARLPADLAPSRFVTFSDLPKNNKGIIDRARLPALLKNKLN
jgi:acyl-coenzyme A synthetase/AMP-(fatty) acid ligase